MPSSVPSTLCALIKFSGYPDEIVVINYFFKHYLLLTILFLIFLSRPRDLWALSSLTWDWTQDWTSRWITRECPNRFLYDYYLFLFFLIFWLHCMAHGVLDPLPTNLHPLHWHCRVLTTDHQGSPGWVWFFSLFYIWGNGGTGRLNNLLQANNWQGSLTSSSWHHTGYPDKLRSFLIPFRKNSTSS